MISLRLAGLRPSFAALPLILGGALASTPAAAEDLYTATCQPQYTEVVCHLWVPIGGVRWTRTISIAGQPISGEGRMTARTSVSNCSIWSVLNATNICNAGTQNVATFRHSRDKVGFIGRGVCGFCATVPVVRLPSRCRPIVLRAGARRGRKPDRIALKWAAYRP